MDFIINESFKQKRVTEEDILEDFYNIVKEKDPELFESVMIEINQKYNRDIVVNDKYSEFIKYIKNEH